MEYNKEKWNPKKIEGNPGERGEKKKGKEKKV
jgi:hypothetical protein